MKFHRILLAVSFSKRFDYMRSYESCDVHIVQISYEFAAISQMFRIRVLECAALQRRDFRTDVLIFCIDKKRSTFSNMHHLLSCYCTLEQRQFNEKFIFSVVKKHFIKLLAEKPNGCCKKKLHYVVELRFNLQVDFLNDCSTLNFYFRI